MVGLLSSMATSSAEPVLDKDYGDLLFGMCFIMLAEALAALPVLYFSMLPLLRPTASSIKDIQASFATGICEAEASGCISEDASLASALSSTAEESNVPEEESLALCKVNYGAMKGPDLTRRIGHKDISAWIAFAKGKDDGDDEDEDEEDDENDDDEDEGADEEDVGDQGEGEEDAQGHDGGDDEQDDDDEDDENGKGDDEDEEEGVEGEDEEDEDAAEDEEDDDEEDDDDETPEPPKKKRK